MTRGLRLVAKLKMTMRYRLVLLALLVGGQLSPSAQAQASRSDLRLGRGLSEEAAVALEQRLADSPGDQAARVQLIGYYFGRFRNSDARNRRIDHVLWFVRNQPEAEVLSVPEARMNQWLDADAFSQARTVWSQHLDSMPDSLKVLRNASTFLMFSNRPRAIELLERAQRIDGSNSLWAKQLGRLHWLDMGRGYREPDAEAAARALGQFERAYELLGPARGDSLLRFLVETCLEAGQAEKARAYADTMLNNETKGWNLGNRIHHGHMTLGRIALAEGNLEEAKNRLLKAGQTPGSPQLNSFGPEMDLAKALLERGEKDVVVRYFELCSEFWNHDRATAKLAEWTELAKSGKVPDFR